MRAGEFPDGSHVLRAKIDMASPNMNLRDPLHVPHPARAPPPHRRRVVHLPDVRLGPRLEDSIEGITHSICTLEFENHRRSTTGSWSTRAGPRPQQIEFAR
jgi:glutaminyl-tRNA synthetase